MGVRKDIVDFSMTQALCRLPLRKLVPNCDILTFAPTNVCQSDNQADGAPEPHTYQHVSPPTGSKFCFRPDSQGVI